MPATNYTPIQLYRTTTSGTSPTAGNMNPGELALNIADNDMSLWMENASGTVKRVFNNPAALKYPTADGTSGQIIKTDGSGNLSFGTASGGALTTNVRQAVTSSATTTINLNSGNVVDLTMAANITTLSFTNVPASGTPILVMIVVKNASDGTAYTVTWPNSVYWSGQYAATTISTVQTAPTLATGANGVTVISLLTTDGGTKWRGWVDATIPGGSLNSLYSWGQATHGNLGLNDTVARSSPVQVGVLTNWASSSKGSNFTVAIKTDGTLWSWGYGVIGRLGQNDTVSKSSPVQVGALTNWAQAACLIQNCAAVKTDGTLWSWGANSYGQLGTDTGGFATSRSSPVQIGAGTTWSKVIGGTFSSFAAIKTDGTLWSWGRNNFGQLGHNDLVNRSSPVQVGALTTWSSGAGGYSFFALVKTDGTLWSWGQGTYGKLGLGDLVNRSSPVQIGAGTTWSKVNLGYGHGLAVKTDGTLWSWGDNGFAQLGLNDTVLRSSPVQVGTLTTWATPAGLSRNSMVIKTDGTLWSWGYGPFGTLGQNNATSRSSPVQVGALTLWSSVGAFSTGTEIAAITALTANPA